MTMFMKKCLFGIQILLIFVPHRPCQLVFYNETVNWYMAQMNCVMKGGEFVTEVKSIEDALPEDGTLAWTSLFADFSDFVEYKGCFSTKVGSDIIIHKRTKLQGDVTVSKCLTICKKEGFSTFSLTAPDVCDCMSAVLTSFRMNYVSQCNVTCAGDIRDICGGDKEMSIYRESYMMGDEPTETSPDVECYAVMKYQDMLQTMSSNCLDIKSGFVCKICEGRLSNCSSEVVNETSSWYDARDTCGRRNGVLDSDRGMIQRYSGDGVFWLGLQRWMVWKDHDEIDGPSKFCVACGRLNGKVSCRSLLCTENHAFLCKEAKAPPMIMPNKTSTKAPAMNTTVDNVLGTNSTSTITTNANTTESATYSSSRSTTLAADNTTTVLVNETFFSSSSSSSESSTLPSSITSIMTSKTSKMAFLTDVQPVTRRRQPNKYGDYFKTWVMLLGIIAGMLFVFSIAFIVLQTYRRHKRKRSFLLPEINHPSNDDPFTNLKRQRSFSNPGFHENGENGDVFLQSSTTDNTRTCDDCSTFTLAKNKGKNLKTESNTSVNSLNLSATDNADIKSSDGESKIKGSESKLINQTTDDAIIKNEKEIDTVCISPEHDYGRDVHDAVIEKSSTQASSIPVTKETIDVEKDLTDNNETKHVDPEGQGRVKENDSDPQLSKSIVDNGLLDDGDDTRAIIPN